MQLTLIRHLWGVDHTHGLDHYLPRWREVGYGGDYGTWIGAHRPWDWAATPTIDD